MDKKEKKHGLRSIIRVFRYLSPFLFLGVAVVIMFMEKETLKNSMKVVRSMPVWIVCMAVAAQICSYLGSGYMLKALMKLGRSRLSVFRGALITMAGASIGLVAGGWVTSAATTYYWLKRDSDGSEAAIMAGLLPNVYNSAVLVGTAVAGMFYLLLNHDLSRMQIYVYGISMAIPVLWAFLLYYGLKNQTKTEHFAAGLVKIVNRLMKRDYETDMVYTWMNQFYKGKSLLARRKWIKPGFGSLMNIFFDLLTLYLFFCAAGYYIKPSILVAGYSLVFLAGKVAFFVPGGAGVIEGGMAAIYTNLGVPGHITIVAVLAYRLVSFWMPILLGYVVTIYLRRAV